MPTKKRKTAGEEGEYKPTEREQDVFSEVDSQYKAQKTPRLKVKPIGENAASISFDHPNGKVAYALLMKAIGTTDYDFGEGLLSHLAIAATKGKKTDETRLNFMISTIKGIQPRDQIEAMLAPQMAAVYTTIMNLFQQLASVGANIAVQESIERQLNKFIRTFAMLMETLKRYRANGEQKVTVQHVSVSEGGQAIVGNIHQAASKTAAEKPANETPALTDARQAPMTILKNKERTAVASQRNRKDAKRPSP